MTAARRSRRAAPAAPHLVASVVAGLTVGLTAPLLLIGLARRADGDVSGVLALLVVIGWGVMVVVVMNLVLPWRRLVVAGVHRDRCALLAAQATRSEQRNYHARWLFDASARALALSLPVVLTTVAVVGGLMDSAVAPRLAWAVLGDLVGVVAAGASTALLLRHRQPQVRSVTMNGN